MFICFDVIHERDRRTDRQTDGQTLHNSKDRACIASRGKKCGRRPAGLGRNSIGPRRSLMTQVQHFVSRIKKRQR